MLLFKKIVDLKDYLSKQKNAGKTIGFVPTMGALHVGHASLIKQSKQGNDLTVCSIFVNPAQFNDSADLKKYPRTESSDIDKLTQLRTDIIFLPDVNEIYPPQLTLPDFEFGQMDKVMEGVFRPGHFEGVVKVVYRLLDIVQPDRLYMGQKDFQQFTLIHEMLRQMHSGIELVVCPIIREADGLALSSRNRRLTPEHRKNAPVIYQCLQQLNGWIKASSIELATHKAIQTINGVPGLKLEYLIIADGHTLLPIDRLESSDYIVACVAVWAGPIRLIDNIILKKEISE